MPEYLQGRTTKGIERIGDRVIRPWKPNTPFVHEVLRFLEQKGVDFVPRVLGETPGNREALSSVIQGHAPGSLGETQNGCEVLSYIQGYVPDNIGEFSDAQICVGAELIRILHDALAEFPGAAPGQTVCHNDLSPCNFVFDAPSANPIGVFDWDAAAIGDGKDDLAYAMWMWLDIGNGEIAPQRQVFRMRMMEDAYGLEEKFRSEMPERILGQMRRVAESEFSDPAQTLATRNWARGCMREMRKIQNVMNDLEG